MPAQEVGVVAFLRSLMPEEPGPGPFLSPEAGGRDEI